MSYLTQPLFKQVCTLVACGIAIGCLLIGNVHNAQAATISLPEADGGSTLLPTSNDVLPEMNVYAEYDEEAGGFGLAQPQNPSALTIEGIMERFALLLNRIAPFIISLTVLVFLWGMLQLVRGGSEQAQKEGKQIIFFGIVALFVMVSVWGLVNVLRYAVRLDNTTPQGPGVPRFK